MNEGRPVVGQQVIGLCYKAVAIVEGCHDCMTAGDRENTGTEAKCYTSIVIWQQASLETSKFILRYGSVIPYRND